MPSKLHELRTGVDRGLGSYLVRFPNQIHLWAVIEYHGGYVTLEQQGTGHRISVSEDQICYVQHSFKYSKKPLANV